MATSGALTTTDQRLARIDAIASDCQLSNTKSMATTLKLARAMQELRNLMQGEVMQGIMSLQGTPLGFLTDKDREKDGSPGKGYPEAVVRDVAIEATLRGLSMIGNEVNIIAGRFYATKNGFARLLREHHGLTDLKITEGKVEMKEGGCFMDMRAEWKLNGKPDSLDVTLGIRVNAGMGMDAIVGKAERKIMARVYKRITGSEQFEDVEDSTSVDPKEPA